MGDQYMGSHAVCNTQMRRWWCILLLYSVATAIPAYVGQEGTGIDLLLSGPTSGSVILIRRRQKTDHANRKLLLLQSKATTGGGTSKQSIWTDAKNVVKSTTKHVGSWFSRVGANISGFFKGVGHAIGNMGRRTGGFFKECGKKTIGFFKESGRKIAGFFKESWKKTSGFFNAFFTTIGEKLAKLFHRK